MDRILEHLRDPSWWFTAVLSLSVWKFVSSVSMPEKFLPQLPYNERSQSSQGFAIPFKRLLTKKLA